MIENVLVPHITQIINIGIAAFILSQYSTF